MRNKILYLLTALCSGITTIQAQNATLSSVIDSALANNNMLHICKLKSEQEQSKTSELKIKRLPVLTLGGGYTYRFKTGELTIPAGSMPVTLPMLGSMALPLEDYSMEIGTKHIWTAGAFLIQPLTQQFRINSGVEAANIDKQLADLEYTSAELQIVNGVEKLFYGIMANRKQQEECQKKIAVAEQKLQDVEVALAAGKTVSANAAGMKAEVANEKQELLKKQMEEQDYLASLKQLTNVDYSQVELQEDEAANLKETSIESLDFYLKKATEGNTDIKKSELLKKKSECGLQASQRANIPDVNAVAAYTYQNQTDIIAKNNPMIGVMASWNLNDLLSNHQKIKQSKIQSQQAEENIELTRKNIETEVEKTYHKLQQAQELVKVAKQAADFRKEQLKIEYDKRDSGLNTPLNVLEAEAEVAKAEADYYGAKQQLNVYVSDMNGIVGK